MNRLLIEDECVRIARNEAECRFLRACDAWEAATFVIVHDPGVGMALTESGKSRAFTFQGSRSNGMPSLTVIYEDQDPFVIVRDVRFWEPRRYEQQVH